MATSKRIVTRHKVLIVPFIRNTAKAYPYSYKLHSNDKVLMVRDTKTNEWGFISGGVKSRERKIDAASRELVEETSGTLCFPEKDMTFVHEFVTLYRPTELLKIDKQRNEIVRSVYTVYMFQMSDMDVNHIKFNFKPNKEVSEVCVDHFNNFTNIWDFCEEVHRSQLT